MIVVMSLANLYRYQMLVAKRGGWLIASTIKRDLGQVCASEKEREIIRCGEKEEIGTVREREIKKGR